MKKAIRKSRKTTPMPVKELLLRRFHQDVRKLKTHCFELSIRLMDIGEAAQKDLCIISSSDYEIGSWREDCVTENENYFLSHHDYEILIESYPNYRID